MGQQALSRAGGAVHLPQAPPQGHRAHPALWSLHPPSILPTSAAHPGLRCSLLSASRMPGAPWRSCRNSTCPALVSSGTACRRACSPPEDRAVRVPCPPPPPQPRHCIWLLADLPDPPLRACTSGTQGHPGPSRAPAVAPWTSTPSWRLRRHSESARPAALRRLEGGSHSLLLLCSQKNRGPGDGVRKGTPPAPGFCF